MLDIKSNIYKIIKDFPDLIAIEMGDQKVSYFELGELASSIAYSLGKQQNLVGVITHRNINTYSCVIGVHWAGAGHVPINPLFPIERSVQMVELSGIKSILCPIKDDPYMIELKKRCPQVEFIDFEDIDFQMKSEIKFNNADDIAYLLFTSGSTGVPKGVAITHKNVTHYIEHLTQNYPLTQNDRCSQTFDLTFDLSIHDVFVTLSQGACLCPLTNSDLFFAAHFIKKMKLTVWFSVPSLAYTIDRMKMLAVDSFPTLRMSFFCGEALEYRIAKQWQIAAPESKVINLYGPTEATIAISEFVFTNDTNLSDCPNGIVPIGKIFPNHNYILTPDDDSELQVSGPQIAPGYWNNESKTQEAFIQKGEQIYYKTGDKVIFKNQNLIYTSRIDNQVKINGHRVELLDIETAFKKIIKDDQVVAVNCKSQDKGDIIVLFVHSTESLNEDELISQAKSIIPHYMLPEQIITIEEIPLNSNGKIDRNALRNSLT